MRQRSRLLSMILTLAFAMAMLTGMTMTVQAEPSDGYPLWVGGDGRDHGNGIRYEEEK